MGKVWVKIGLGMTGLKHDERHILQLHTTYNDPSHSAGFVTSIHQKAQSRGFARLLWHWLQSWHWGALLCLARCLCFGPSMNDMGKRHHRRLVFEGAPEMRPVYRFGLKLQWPRKDSSRHQTIGNDQKIEKSIIIYYIYHLLSISLLGKKRLLRIQHGETS